MAPANTLESLGYLLRQPKIWGMALGFAAYGYSFYLFLTWLPTYIQGQLHVSILNSAGLVAIILLGKIEQIPAQFEEMRVDAGSPAA